MGRSEAGLTAACTVKQDLKRWQGSGVWLPALRWRQSWPQGLLQINQLRMVTLQSLNLSSKKVTFRSLNKLDNNERLSQERLYSKEVLKEKVNQRVRKKEMEARGKEEKEGKDKEKIKPVKEINQKPRKKEMEKEARQEKIEKNKEKIKQEEQRN